MPTAALSGSAVTLASAAGTSVTSAVPDTASLSTTLDVRVKGSGFRSDAVAKWAFDGVTDESQVKVNHTKYVSSRELIANVTISGSAKVGQWDVIVTMSGKTGVGTESAVGPDLFQVLDVTATLMFPLDDATLSMRSDRKYSDGTYSVYAHGSCGVSARWYYDASQTGDVVMATGYNSYRRKCVDFPRPVTTVFEDGVIETRTAWMNMNRVQNAVFRIPIGTTVLGAFRLGSARCNRVVWGREGGDSVRVTRVDDSTWDIETQPPPYDRGYCLTNGQTFHMPVRFRIVSSRPLD